MLEELLAKFTDASTYQYLAAAVALVWLVGVTGILRGRSRSADASLPKMAMWFAVSSRRRGRSERSRFAH